MAAAFFIFLTENDSGRHYRLGSPRESVPLIKNGRKKVRMLVLTRKVGEAIMIRDHIRIVVVEISGEKVRLGIAAPKEVIVDRQEIHDKRNHLPDEGTDLGIYHPVP